MHVLVPFASDPSEAARHVLQDLALPNLSRFLGASAVDWRSDGDADSCSPPHERALAAARGWHGGDGALPFAAQAAAADGIAVGDEAWGLLTPCHWALGRDRIVMADPAGLGLDEAESQALFEALRDLLESDGFTARRGAATRWYVARDDLHDLPTASLDRVAGNAVEPWLDAPGEGAAQAKTRRALRRLQSEAQLVFHAHAVNEARDERGLPAVNSFWLSGCGRAQPIVAGAGGVEPPAVDDRLRGPALAGDWVAWREAWAALDAGPIGALTAAADGAADRRGGRPPSLTLCGARSAVRHAAAPRSTWQRWRGRWSAPSPQAALDAL